jgi:addiction module HigA family antidote
MTQTLETKARDLPPIHPGEILLEEFMKPLSLSANKLAHFLCVPVNRITTILKGERGITADTALRLYRYFGLEPQFWLNLQTSYDLEVATKEVKGKIFSTVFPRSKEHPISI